MAKTATAAVLTAEELAAAAAATATAEQKPSQQVSDPAAEQAQAQATSGTGTDVMVVDFGDDAGKGLQNVTADEFSIPIIRILQSNSPQVDPTDGKYIKGAAAGMLLKTSTNEVFDGLTTGLQFIPVHRDHNYVEYTPRDAGGGFVGIRWPKDPLVLELIAKQGKFGKLVTTTGTELTEVFSLYGIFALENYVFRAMLPFASTQIKKYTAFMEIQTGIEYPNGKGGTIKPPMWAHRWHLNTRGEANKKGKYMGYVLGMEDGATPQAPRPALMKLTDPRYVAGREFYELIAAGRVKVDHESNAAAGGSGTKNDADDDIPF